LSLYGTGGARLHEELIEVAARWTDPADRKGKGLQPYSRDAEQKTLELLETALGSTAKSLPEQVLKRLAAATRRDVQELTPALEREGTEARKDAERRLKERAQRESDAMRALLVDQEKRIRETEKKAESPQYSIDFKGDEAKQLERDRQHWRKRLARLAEDQKREPDRILESYEVKAARIEPVGIAYLWPATG
jgi:hypothetical protein